MGEIWASFRRLPIAVQLWVGIGLLFVNLATVLFIGERNGGWIFALMLAGILPNLPIVLVERGMSRLLSVPHLIGWTPMLILAVVTLVQGTTSTHATFLVILLITDAISLVFDAKDFREWMNGDRSIA